jgi:hypothetical protein
MRIANEAKGYKSVITAEAKLAETLARLGESLDSVRWIMAVNNAGRFVPVLMVSHMPEKGYLLGIVHGPASIVVA